MARYVAFLRAINVGGRIVKMDALKTIFEAMRFAKVETFIASGNVIFESKSTDTAAMEKKIEAQLLKTLSYEVATFVRSDVEVAAIAVAKPFPAKAIEASRAYCVGFLHAPLPDEKALKQFVTEVDDFKPAGREIYWLCKVGQSESEFNNARMEKKLGVRATFRGLNTIVRLAAKYPASPPKS